MEPTENQVPAGSVMVVDAASALHVPPSTPFSVAVSSSSAEGVVAFVSEMVPGTTTPTSAGIAEMGGSTNWVVPLVEPGVSKLVVADQLVGGRSGHGTILVEFGTGVRTKTTLGVLSLMAAKPSYLYLSNKVMSAIGIGSIDGVPVLHVDASSNIEVTVMATSASGGDSQSLAAYPIAYSASWGS